MAATWGQGESIFTVTIRFFPAVASTWVTKVQGPAVIFTFVTNHFTVIFIYPFQCWIGALLTGSGYSKLMAELDTFFKNPTVHNFLNIGWEVAVAFLVGGAVLALVAAVPGYFLSRAMVIEFRKKRAEHMIQKNLRKKLQ